MFTKNLSLFFPLLFLLHTFLNFNVVTAIRFQRRAPVDLRGLNTNAERFAAGLTPNPPARRWVPSRPEGVTLLFKITSARLLMFFSCQEEWTVSCPVSLSSIDMTNRVFIIDRATTELLVSLELTLKTIPRLVMSLKPYSTDSEFLWVIFPEVNEYNWFAWPLATP